MRVSDGWENLTFLTDNQEKMIQTTALTTDNAGSSKRIQKRRRFNRCRRVVEILAFHELNVKNDTHTRPTSHWQWNFSKLILHHRNSLMFQSCPREHPIQDKNNLEKLYLSGEKTRNHELTFFMFGSSMYVTILHMSNGGVLLLRS